MKPVNHFIIRRLCPAVNFIRCMGINQEKALKNNLFIKFLRIFSKIIRK